MTNTASSVSARTPWISKCAVSFPATLSAWPSARPSGTLHDHPVLCGQPLKSPSTLISLLQKTERFRFPESCSPAPGGEFHFPELASAYGRTVSRPSGGFLPAVSVPLCPEQHGSLFIRGENLPEKNIHAHSASPAVRIRFLFDNIKTKFQPERLYKQTVLSPSRNSCHIFLEGISDAHPSG